MKKSIPRMFIMLAILIAGLSTGLAAQASPHFVISVNPSVVNIAQGSTASLTVTTVVDGRPSFEFSLTGLPAGVIAQSRVGRSGANTVVLSALPTAATGSYSVDITATTGTSSQTQTFTLNVKPMPPIQWEYHVEISGTAQQFQNAANALGEQGWELVSLVLHEEGGVPELIGVFKREKL